MSEHEDGYRLGVNIDHSSYHQGRPKWGMTVDIDRCTGCQGCVVACWSENNVMISTEQTD